MIIILSVLDILSIIQLEGQWKRAGWGLTVKFLSLRLDTCVTLISAFNLADLGMITTFLLLSMFQT